MDWRDHIRTRLLAIQPASVCALDESARLLVHAIDPAIAVQRYDPELPAPCALVLGINALDTLDAHQARHLISQARLYAAPRMLLAASSACPLDDDTFRALGFMLIATDSPNNMRVMYYDIDSYKIVPDWLNARYWAHPERWEP